MADTTLNSTRLRQTERRDYVALNNGPSLPKDRLKKESWSTTKLYHLVVVDSKFIAEKLYVKVHYTDKEWDSAKYDEWRSADEVLDIPNCYLENTPEGKAFFLQQLKIAIKESLHGQRKVDSIVNIELPIQKDLFHELALHGKRAQSRLYYIQSLVAFDSLLEEGWHWRIFNSQGDFAFVTPNTISFRLTERRPLEQYSAEGNLEVLHRGFMFKMKFARGMGNAFDFQSFAK